MKPLPPRLSGTPWGEKRTDPVTGPGPPPVLITEVSGPCTERDRKLWGVLLHAVWPEVGEVPVHEVPLDRITGMFQERGGGRSSAWIWPAAQRLASTRVQWIDTAGDQRSPGVEAVFGAVVNAASTPEATLRFHFPPLLLPLLQDPRGFARLRTHVLLGLSGKYTATLYELVEAVATRPEPYLTVPLPDLRRWLQLPAGVYALWYELKRWVLDPALKQFNHHPDEGTGLRVTMTPLRRKRAIHAVHFDVQKTAARTALERRLAQQQSLLLLPAAAYDQAQACVPGEDVYALQGKWEDRERCQPSWPPQYPGRAFVEFCQEYGRAQRSGLGAVPQASS